MADEIVDLFFEDLQAHLPEYLPPLVGRADLLVAELMKQVMFQGSGPVFTQPLGILQTEFADDKHRLGKSFL